MHDQWRWCERGRQSAVLEGFTLTNGYGYGAGVRIYGSSPTVRSDIANLPDLNFRINHARGRVVWEWQGEEYTKHFYPAQPAQLRVHRHEQAYKEKDIEQGEAA